MTPQITPVPAASYLRDAHINAASGFVSPQSRTLFIPHLGVGWEGAPAAFQDLQTTYPPRSERTFEAGVKQDCLQYCQHGR